MPAPKPLAHLKVVELASVLAGPAVGQFFAELGAKVIKIENKTTGGDVTRNWKNPKEDTNAKVSAYFASVNFGKTHLLLDLSSSEDRKLADQHLADADVVIANFKPESAQKLGLDYDSVKKLNPTVVYGEITGFERGNTRPAFDVVLQAETGYLSMTGFSDRPFAKLPVALIDLLAAHQLKQGILLALLQQHQKKTAKRVSVSLIEAGLSSLANQASNWLTSGFLPKAMGSQHPNIAPYGDRVVLRNGKQILFSIGTEKQFNSLWNLLGLSEEEMASFDNNVKRVKNRPRLMELLQRAVLQQDPQNLLKDCLRRAVPFGEILTLEEVFDREPAKSMIVKDEQEGQTLKRVKTVVFSIDD